MLVCTRFACDPLSDMRSVVVFRNLPAGRRATILNGAHHDRRFNQQTTIPLLISHVTDQFLPYWISENELRGVTNAPFQCPWDGYFNIAWRNIDDNRDSYSPIKYLHQSDIIVVTRGNRQNCEEKGSEVYPGSKPCEWDDWLAEVLSLAHSKMLGIILILDKTGSKRSFVNESYVRAMLDEAPQDQFRGIIFVYHSDMSPNDVGNAVRCGAYEIARQCEHQLRSQENAKAEREAVPEAFLDFHHTRLLTAGRKSNTLRKCCPGNVNLNKMSPTPSLLCWNR